MPIDLDKARAARREAEQTAPVIILAGQEYELPIELPFEVARLMVAALGQLNDVKTLNATLDGVLRALLSDVQYKKFMKAKPSLEDITELVIGLAREYGLTAGESPASADS